MKTFIKNLLKTIKQEKIKYLVLPLLAFLYWGLTFYTDTKIFSSDALNMNCLPVDLSAVPLMHVLTKVLLLILLVGLLEFLYYGIKHPKLLLAFFAFLLLYAGLLLLNFPGYYMSDDAIIFGYATRFYPVYWHCYLTSLYYMVGMSLIPASVGPILLNALIHALLFSYIFYEADRLYQSKVKYLLLLCGVMPFTLLGSLMCFRPALYAPFFVFFFAFLFFEKKKEAKPNLRKLLFLGLLISLLCLWRSEGITLFVFALLLIPLTYGGFSKKMLQKLLLFLLCFVIFFGIIKIPQSRGEEKYYGSDYLIIATIRPISLMIHRDQTYKGADEDLANINKVINLDYISYETLSCSSYNRYNSDFNEGRFTQTGADENTQKAYLKSAFRLILHNLDLYAAERLQLFCVTNGIYNYNKSMVLNLEPVNTSDYHLYVSDQAYGYELIDGNKRLPIAYNNEISLFLFQHGGEAFIPMLVVLLITLVWSLIKKEWFLFVSSLSLFAREAVIFLTAPASFIQYSYPTMYTAAFLFLVLLLTKMEKRKLASLSKQ